jgi:hypothetical protein
LPEISLHRIACFSLQSLRCAPRILYDALEISPSLDSLGFPLLFPWRLPQSIGTSATLCFLLPCMAWRTARSWCVHLLHPRNRWPRPSRSCTPALASSNTVRRQATAQIHFVSTGGGNDNDEEPSIVAIPSVGPLAPPPLCMCPRLLARRPVPHLSIG